MLKFPKFFLLGTYQTKENLNFGALQMFAIINVTVGTVEF